MSDDKENTRQRLREYTGVSMHVPAHHVHYTEPEVLRFIDSEVARLSQPAPAQSTDTETEARCRLNNALIATVNSPDHADFTRYQEALENLIEVVRGSVPAQDRATREVYATACSGDKLTIDRAAELATARICSLTEAQVKAKAAEKPDCGCERYDLFRFTVTAERAGKDGMGT